MEEVVFQRVAIKDVKQPSALLTVNADLSRQLVSFQANKKLPFYRLFKYKEGFSSKLVKTFIARYPLKSGLILDPFAGAGTTLFSAREAGFRSIGLEILPLGEFVVQSRLALERVPAEELKRYISKMKELDFAKLPSNPETNFKHIPITRMAFSEHNEKALNGFLSFIETRVKDQDIKQVLKFAGFSILEAISFTRKDGQYLRWDSRSGKTKTKFNKGKILRFEEALFSKLAEMLEDKQPVVESELGGFAPKVITGSCLEILPTMQAESVDLVVTSPPYCNRYDYTRTYALELVYLGCNQEEVKELRQAMLTCTVENHEKIELLRRTYGDVLFNRATHAFMRQPALQKVLSELGKLKDEGKLNNPGIYSMVKNYFFEMSFVIFELARLLKKGGEVYFVNDNVRYAGCNIPVDLILCDFASSAGLKVKSIWVLENGKGNSSQQMGVHGRAELRKCVYYWSK